MSLPKAISNTSPILFLYRIDAISLLEDLFSELWVPGSVQEELIIGGKCGYPVPCLSDFKWIKIINPKSMPLEWLSLDLGKGELAAMALAIENPELILLLDDRLARRTAQFAGLKVWGTLNVLFTAKSLGKIEKIKPFINKLCENGMWISDEIKKQVLTLAGENT